MLGRPTWPRRIRRDVASARERGTDLSKGSPSNSRQPFKIVMSSRAPIRDHPWITYPSC